MLGLDVRKCCFTSCQFGVVQKNQWSLNVCDSVQDMPLYMVHVVKRADSRVKIH